MKKLIKIKMSWALPVAVCSMAIMLSIIPIIGMSAIFGATMGTVIFMAAR